MIPLGRLFMLVRPLIPDSPRLRLGSEELLSSLLWSLGILSYRPIKFHSEASPQRPKPIMNGIHGALKGPPLREDQSC